MTVNYIRLEEKKFEVGGISAATAPGISSKEHFQDAGGNVPPQTYVVTEYMKEVGQHRSETLKDNYAADYSIEV